MEKYPNEYMPINDPYYLKKYKAWEEEEDLERPRGAHSYASGRYVDFHYIKSLHNYLTQSLDYKYKSEVVYKRISTLSGSRSLQNVMKYVMRELDYQVANEEEKVKLYGSDGNEIKLNELDMMVTTWNEKSYSQDLMKKDTVLAKKIERIDYLRTSLSLKINDKDNSEEEEKQYQALLKGFLREKIWKHDTVVKNNLDKKEYRIYNFIGSKCICVDENGKKKSFDKLGLTPIKTAEGFNIKKASEDCLYPSSDDDRFYIKGLSDSFYKRNAPKDYDHFILSSGGDSPNKKKTFKATKEFLDSSLKARGYDYMMAMHDDTDHLHFHVIVNKKNELHKSYEYPSSLFNTFIFRKEYADMLNAHGIDRTVTLKRDRSRSYSYLHERADKLEASKTRFFEQLDGRNKDQALNSYTLSQAMNENIDIFSKKLDEDYKKKLKPKEFRNIKSHLQTMRKELDYKNEERLRSSIDGFGIWVEKQAPQILDFWKKEIYLNDLSSMKNYKKYKRGAYAIEQQEKLQKNFISAYKGLMNYERRISKDNPRQIKQLAVQKEMLGDLILDNDKALSYIKKTKPQYLDYKEIESKLAQSMRHLSRSREE